MSKSDLAKIFKELGLLLELKGENPFKTRSYSQGSRTLDKSDYSLEELVVENKLKNLQGFGPALTDKVKEFYQSGSLSLYKKLKEEVDQGLQDFVKLSGIGPKKARFLFYDLGAKSLGELEYACLENRLVKLKGYGEKTQEKILQAIQYQKSHLGKKLLSEALKEGEDLLNQISKIEEVEQAELMGGLRRCSEIISEISILIQVSSLNYLENFISKFNFIKKISKVEDHYFQGVSDQGLPVKIYFTDKKSWGYQSILRTGNEDHLKKLNLEKINYDSFDEKSIYEKLGMQFIPSELREGLGEIELAKKNQIPDLVELKDLQGCFHAHSLYSDGKNSIQEMSQACEEMNLSYLGLSDHSQTAVYANGLKSEDIDRQHQEIDSLDSKKVKIFKGIESDILKDGSLDYEEKDLAKFDFVIASIHQRFKANKEEMTQRLITALKNPYTTMLGHLSGRLLLSRPEYEIDMDAILETAAQYHKIIEINANPYRLDIDWRFLAKAKKLGVKIAINPDAHSVKGLQDIKYGVMMARKGGLSSKDIINTSSQEDILKEVFNHV